MSDHEIDNPETPDDLSRQLSETAVAELREAREVLEHEGMADRLVELVGAPITASLKMLPSGAEKTVYSAIDRSLSLALDVALKTLRDPQGGHAQASTLRHKLLVGLSGAAGGALGGATVAAELPISTLLILRSIADIARGEGEDLSDVRSRLACLEVFALSPGKNSRVQDDTQVGYFAVRAALAKQVRDAAQHVAKHGATNLSAQPLTQLVAKIGERFGVVVTQKFTAQAIPVIGALGGALINSYFIDHYQDLARAHFTVRRLERQYGAATVRAGYDQFD